MEGDNRVTSTATCICLSCTCNHVLTDNAVVGSVPCRRAVSMAYRIRLGVICLGCAETETANNDTWLG